MAEEEGGWEAESVVSSELELSVPGECVCWGRGNPLARMIESLILGGTADPHVLSPSVSCLCDHFAQDQEMPMSLLCRADEPGVQQSPFMNPMPAPYT